MYALGRGDECQDPVVDAADVARAIDAAISITVALGLPADDAIVLQSSNKLPLRLLPCDVLPESHPWGTSTERSRSSLLDGSPIPRVLWRLWSREESRGPMRVTASRSRCGPTTNW
jgi:hypothetical protein